MAEIRPQPAVKSAPSQPEPGGYLACHIGNPLFMENSFRGMEPEDRPLPLFAGSRHLLPEPFWDGHQGAVDLWWRTWELAFTRLRRPAPGTGFIANFITTSFADCLFMWDSAFIIRFARYGARVFDFQRTLDNLYAKQHPDGFICRQIREKDGGECFHRFDPSSTGPNILAWSEWDHFELTGDRDRLGRVFPVLVAYHRWMRSYRTWPDGAYWTTGWGCGMDNQPRFPGGPEGEWHHGWGSWIDSTIQQALSADMLVRIAGELGRLTEATDMVEEYNRLAGFINARMWDEKESYYFDLKRDGVRTGVKTIGAYWALLAGLVPPEHLAQFVAHLENPGEFLRPHRIPSLSADHPDYRRPDGGYWLGGVWPPTNYMVMRGLDAVGKGALAHEIALNHLDNIVEVFRKTGTVWENYAPEAPAPGNPAVNDFVGWGGVGPVAVFIEYVLGLCQHGRAGRLIWDIRLLEEHGVRRFPFGTAGLVDLKCLARKSRNEKPKVEAASTVPLKLVIRWEGGEETIDCPRR